MLFILNYIISEKFLQVLWHFPVLIYIYPKNEKLELYIPTKYAVALAFYSAVVISYIS